VTNVQGSNVVGAVAQASHATNADYATSASSATSATSAVYASGLASGSAGTNVHYDLNRGGNIDLILATCDIT
jgi:hypothetical protein